MSNTEFSLSAGLFVNSKIIISNTQLSSATRVRQGVLTGEAFAADFAEHFVRLGDLHPRFLVYLTSWHVM